MEQFAGNRRQESEIMTWPKILIKAMKQEGASPETIANVRSALDDHGFSLH
jgi:hypothetical protein